MKRPRSVGPSRRQVALGGAAFCALLTGAPGAPGAAADLARYLEISRRLTGREDLDSALGARYLEALPTDASLDSLKRDILLQWYTGLTPTPEGPRVVTYEGALLWPATGADQPIGSCRGVTGFWSEPPA
ncbi:MAG: sugar dehydrogenase complex small subunit [Pseudomonadota bacterium]